MLEVIASEYDVVVAGGGGAGLMAALEAAERGASVLLVERQPKLGGTTLQAAAGIRDDVEAHYRDYLKFIPPDHRPEDYDLELTRLLVERAPDALARLMELGIQFSGPHPEPPHTVYRMHNVLPSSEVYADVLSRAAEDRGATILTETVIEELRRGHDGVISGVMLGHVGSEEEREVKVNGGVVLATGYFSANGRPAEYASVEPNYSAATGDGIALATAVGATAAGMWAGDPPHFRTVQRPYIHPGAELFGAGAVLVNADGRRYVNELDAPELATSRQPGKVAFIVFDSRLAAQVATADDDSEMSRDGWYRNCKMFLSTFPAIAYAYMEDYKNRTEYFYEAGSVADLAGRIGVPGGAFAEDMGRLNGAAAGRSSDPLGRDPVGAGISEPPFHALAARPRII